MVKPEPGVHEYHPLDLWTIWFFSFLFESESYTLSFQKIPVSFLRSQDQILRLAVKEPWHSHQVQGLQGQIQTAFPSPSSLVSVRAPHWNYLQNLSNTDIQNSTPDLGMNEAGHCWVIHRWFWYVAALTTTPHDYSWWNLSIHHRQITWYQHHPYLCSSHYLPCLHHTPGPH